MSTSAIPPVSPNLPPLPGKRGTAGRRANGCGPSRMWDEESREGWRYHRPVVDPVASIRAQITPALRRACQALAVWENQRRFPARYSDVWAALARTTKNPRKRAHHIAQFLAEKLVELGVLFWFDRKRQKLDVSRLGIFAELLRKPLQDLRFGD